MRGMSDEEVLSATVEHFNFALRKHRLEPIYGLSGPARGQANDDGELVSVEDLAKAFSAPAVPLKPVLALHWLAVNGTQPAVPENPVVLSDKAQDELKTLPKEFQNLYVRIVGSLLQAADAGTQRAVCGILAEDQCLQPLVPLLARFFHTQIKSHCRSQPTSHLSMILDAMAALQGNRHVSLEAHLTQMLPGVFTLVAAPQLGNDGRGAGDGDGGHWALRKRAARLIASLVRRYQSVFPDLFARVCRTYLDALSPPSGALPTVFGGIVGLAALGEESMRQLLLPAIPKVRGLLGELFGSDDDAAPDAAMDVDEADGAAGGARKRPASALLPTSSQRERQHRRAEALQCQQALREALAVLQRSRLPLHVRRPTTGGGVVDEPADTCDLDESLGIFLAAQSPQTIPHAFLSL